MGKMILISAYFDEEVIQKASELGLNRSKICEKALTKAIERLEGSASKFGLHLHCFLSPKRFGAPAGI